MQQEIRVTVPDLFRFLVRGLPWAIAGGLLVGVAAAWLSDRREPTFETRATVLATQPEDDGSFELGALAPTALDVNAYRAVATSDPLLTEVLTALDVQPTQSAIRALRSRITVQAEETRISSLIHIDVQGHDADDAAELANLVATSLVEWDRRRALSTADRVVERLQAQVDAVERQIQSLRNQGGAEERIAAELRLSAERQAQLSYVRAIADSVPGLLEVIQPAPVPPRPSSPSQRFFVIIGGALGLVTAYGVLLLRELTITRVRDVEELARITGLPVLAGYPRGKRTNRRLSNDATSFLRANLLLRLEGAGPKVVLVTSARRGDGKSSVSISLAESLAKSGLRTLLIDADTRRPVIASEYAIDVATPPAGNRSSRTPPNAVSPVEVKVDSERTLHVVPSVQRFSYRGDLSGARLGEAIHQWQREYDIVIVDSGPILSVADPLVIAPYCTGTILVASVRGTEQGLTGAARDMLLRAGVNLLGVVATQMPRGFRSSLRYDANPQVERQQWPRNSAARVDNSTKPLIDSRVKHKGSSKLDRRR